MKRLMKMLVALLAVLTMLGATAAYARQDNKGLINKQEAKTNRLEKLRGYEKHLKNFITIDGEKIRVRDQHVNFDVAPVIKEGRTLIPVRAITEAMGGDVLWDAEHGIATIIKWDGSLRIDFFLDNVKFVEEDDDEFFVDEGKMYFLYQGKRYFVDEELMADASNTEGYHVLAGTIAVYERIEGAWIYKEDLNKADVLPGLINGRTFVPLRFISETFGMKVGWNPDTGQITIDDEIKLPHLVEKSVTYYTEAEVPEFTPITVITGDYEFMSINGVGVSNYEVDELAVADPTTQASLVIRLKEAYIKTLAEEETELTLNFENADGPEEREFKIKLKYNDIEDIELPHLLLNRVTYDRDGAIPDYTMIPVITGDFEFISIDGVGVTNYEVDELAVTDPTTQASLIIKLKKDFVEDLEEDTNRLTFNFYDGIEMAKKKFTILFE